MNLYKVLGVLLLSALVVSCKKKASSPLFIDPPVSPLQGVWQWQYSTSGLNPGQDTLFPATDSAIQLTCSKPNVFTVSVNGNLRFGGTLTLSDSLLTLTPSAKGTGYAWDVVANGTIPSEYVLSLSNDTLALSKHFIIPGATGPYNTPAEPAVIYFTHVVAQD